jgi:hypothetical protein
VKDILLAPDGDLSVSEYGDISLTDSVGQAVRVRLRWFLNEWRFAPEFGVPYFEEILVKNPNLERIRRIVRDEALSVNEVTDAKNITVSADKASRTAKITLDIVTAEGTFREEAALIYA